MADYPVEELGRKTPLQYARLPAADDLARRGILGMVKTIPEGMPPGSDTANLAVLGYNPRQYFTGRSPFEAIAMGVAMQDGDISFRCNLVTLSGEARYDAKTMIDYSAGEISSAESKELIESVNEHLGTAAIRFYPGVSYRHLMIWSGGPERWRLTPPHDILGQRIKPYLPEGEKGFVLEQMMRQSGRFLRRHAINRKRVDRGLRPANSIWIWGEGKKPLLPDFEQKYGLKGTIVAAVDLVKGIAICAGMEVATVEGATGNINTNFTGKAEAALDALAAGRDFVYIHIEAPDECSHHCDVANKVRAIELIDQKIVRVIKETLDRRGEAYRIMFLTDHATPLSLRTHTADPVPFLIYQNNGAKDNPRQSFDEICAAGTGLYLAEGHALMELFLKGRG
jgi:2,3-bisphosphoglycerate-independent phosphoglycerate mutase